METKGTQEQGKTTGTTQQSATGGVQGASQGSTGGTYGTTQSGTTQSATGTAGGSATQRARDPRSEMNRSAEVIDQAKQTLSEAYDKTSQTLSATYDQAIDYGREHPGQLTLIAFGAGIGIGLLLASGFSPRNRTSRILPPVMNALTEVVTELFR